MVNMLNAYMMSIATSLIGRQNFQKDKICVAPEATSNLHPLIVLVVKQVISFYVHNPKNLVAICAFFTQNSAWFGTEAFHGSVPPQ